MNYTKKLKMLGLNISYYRKLRSLTQEQLAEKVGIDRAYLGKIEAPNMIEPCSLKTIFRISDVLEIPESELLNFKKY